MEDNETRKRQADEDTGKQVDEGPGGLRGDEAEDERLEAVRKLEQEIRSLPVSDHLFLMMHSLSELALARMGLGPDSPNVADLEQARLAIDAYKALLELLSERRPQEEVGPRRQVLAQLQLAFVAALDKGAGKPAEGGSG